MSLEFTPRELVGELDKFIVGQQDAKRAVAIAVRNRWRRKQLTGSLKDEVHPKNIILLTADAFGVLPPVSKLTPAQAMYHFISGYTAKVAGTEVGVEEPEATFSACFGAAFIVWHPSKYAELLAAKMKEHGAKAWLVNTGWSGGPYGVGSRIKLEYTRAIIDAIHEGGFEGAN